MESHHITITAPQATTGNFFRKPHNGTVSFAIGLLLFLLPFAELKCGSVVFAGNTGVGLAVGTEWKIAMGNDLFGKMNSRVTKQETKDLSTGPNFFLLVAIAAVLFGMAVSFSAKQWRHVAGMCAGILACIMFIAVLIQFKLMLKASMAGVKQGGLDHAVNGLIKMSFTTWFYLSFAAFAAAAFFNYKHHANDMQDALDRAIDFEFQEKKPGPPFG